MCGALSNAGSTQADFAAREAAVLNSLQRAWGAAIRFLCNDRLQLAIQQARRNGTRVALLFIDLEQTLGLPVVAEGVELASDVQLLQNTGCDELQGFHFGRPMAAGEFAAWMLAYEAALV